MASNKCKICGKKIDSKGLVCGQHKAQIINGVIKVCGAMVMAVLLKGKGGFKQRR